MVTLLLRVPASIGLIVTVLDPYIILQFFLYDCLPVEGIDSFILVPGTVLSMLSD